MSPSETACGNFFRKSFGRSSPRLRSPRASYCHYWEHWRSAATSRGRPCTTGSYFSRCCFASLIWIQLVTYTSTLAAACMKHRFSSRPEA